MLRALVTGFGRVLAAPAVLVGAYLVTLLAAVPLAAVLHDSLRQHLGTSLMADAAADGVNWDWWQEFSGQTSGLATSFTPSIIGFAAPLGNLSSLFDAGGRPSAVVIAVAAFGGAWFFLWGGILDRYARGRATRAHGFFAACGTFFFRFLRLGLIAGVLYWALFGPTHAWLFDTAYGWLTRDLTSERQSFLWRLGLYAVFGAALVAVNVVVDYAKIRAVVEDRRSMIGAFFAGGRFVVRQPGATLSLYLLNGLLFLTILGFYALLAPGTGGGWLSVWWAFFAGQLYVLGRLLLRLTFAASQVCLFQSRLAHVGYTATTVPMWPDSPAAEAIANAATLPR